MKNKNNKSIYGFLILLILFSTAFSFKLIFMHLNSLNYTVSPNLPLSSANEITINTPENKTYTGAMSGYYPATYGFENEADGATGTGIKFVDTETNQGSSYLRVISDLDGHDKALEAYDGSTVGRNQITHDFISANQTSGTIEFYWRITTASYGANLYFYGTGASGSSGLHLGMESGYFVYRDASDFTQNIVSYSVNTWYHVRIDFECGSGGYMGLAADRWHVYINDVLYGDYVFRFGTDLDYQDSILFYNGWWAGSGYNIYYDAWGESWDPNYNVGDNLNEGLLLGYENTTNLEWQGYSLDGQSNKTIYGNTTIPLPAGELHMIQVYGNNSVGTMFESNLRYFSIQDITINTPENKTYNVPMSGYYPATYGFENEIDGTTGTGINLVDTETNQGSSYFRVISDLDGHEKVLEAYDGSSAGRNQITHNFFSANQSSGTIEFYWRITTATYGANLYFSGTGTSGSSGLHFGMEGGYFVRRDASDVILNIVPYSINTWYHIRIDFECGSGGYMGLAADRYHVYINDVLYGDYIFRFGSDLDYQNSVLFYNGWWAGSGYNIYYDAWGESWDPNYNLGDNLKEGLLLSYDTKTDFNWTSYSLDGLGNNTILGNTTIPIYNDGRHSIQVFGNDSLGIMYESAIRYFTTNTLAPTITINSPLSNALMESVAPSFDLTIPDLDLTNRWYSLDGGTTNIPFSGLTGTIDQTEWDKIGNGTAMILFFANDTANNIGQAEVTLMKDILGPIIIINSPQGNDVFGFNSPHYDLSIEEFNLDSIWYSFDYGVTVLPLYTLTGTLDQTDWETESSGTIPIRFYANDSLGHESFADVLVVKDITNPIVTINSPSVGEVFGHLPPDYDILITEPNLDSYWYTLDGGSVNITISSFTGIINLTEWEKYGNGTVTIRFYAKDEGGNEGFAEITIRKDINIPLININSPNTNDIFGLQPPQYDISVVEPDIDTMWYTLDNGVTNTSFTEFTGTIDQTEWDKFGDSIVIIRFYVRDKGGNEAFAEVSVNKDLIAPVVTINEPEFGEVFVDISPLYSITIDESFLESFWYSLDDGLTNYTISELTGTIDQDAWDSLPDGYVTLRFYAKDEAGNVGQSSTTITKRTTPGPTPPGISGYNIIALIGVSCIVTLIILKKKPTKN